MTSALLRLGAGRLLALAGGSVGGIGMRLAGYSRSGVVSSRRWMALTGKRLLKQHDISWNESDDTNTPTRLWTGTLPSFSCTVTSLYLTVFYLTLQVFSKPPCPAKNCCSKAFSSAVVDSVGATPGFIDVSNYFSSLPSCFHLYLSFIL